MGQGMFQTTRRWLALWYTAVTAILVLLFATGVYLYVRSTLIERVDDTLNHVVEVVRRSLVIEPVFPRTEGGPLRVNVEASFRDSAATGEDDRIDIEWFSPTGELIWSTFSATLPLPLHVNSDGETVRVAKTAENEPLILRQITQRVEVGRSMLGYLRVSHPWFEVTKPSRAFFVDLILGSGVMIGAVGAIGWFLSGLAMRPVYDSYQRLKQFTADASHELRSPIAVIQTNVQVALADPDPDPATQQQHLQVVERLTRRLGKLVDDLLFLARQDSGIVQLQWEAIALDTLLQEIVEEQQAVVAEKALHLSYGAIAPETNDTPRSAQESWATVQGDRDQLARLFTNIIDNAVQYTPPGGSITLTLQRGGRLHNGTLHVTLTDTGIGIPAEAIPQLFERFYRVDPARRFAGKGGSGLGLAIAAAIVQSHHGQIQITSPNAQGTTVQITLPQKQPE